MARRSFFILITLLLSSNVFSQKKMEKIWDVPDVQKVEIISDEVFHIILKTVPTKQITANASIEGEYHKDILLRTTSNNGVFKLEPAFRPYFEKPNDKLAAHKIISIELIVEIPENLNILIKSTFASVEAEGNYKNVFIGLREGNCELTNFNGNATLQSVNGDITVEANNSKGEAISKNGTVINRLGRTGKYIIKAESVNGLITLINRQQ